MSAFFAVLPIAPNLGRGPLHTESVLKRGVLYGIQVFSDLGEAEIRGANVTGVHKDVELIGRQRGMR